jgi:hypothetical protein
MGITDVRLRIRGYLRFRTVEKMMICLMRGAPGGFAGVEAHSSS